MLTLSSIKVGIGRASITVRKEKKRNKKKERKLSLFADEKIAYIKIPKTYR